jgi:hypothetical protein
MTHEELLAELNKLYNYNPYYKAICAVVKLHEEYTTADGVAFCVVCRTSDKQLQYPCPTIQAIEKELA